MKNRPPQANQINIKTSLPQTNWVSLCVFMAFISLTGLLNATETTSETTSTSSRSSTSSGYWEIGMRSVDLDGSENKYKQHVNLDDGMRLSAFGFVFKPEEKTAITPDRIEIHASNLGSEPYQNIRIGIRKYGSYRFSYERQKSEYFYQDILIESADENPNRSNGGDFHHFDFDRVRDRLNFDINLSDKAKILLDLNQYSKKGESTTVLDIEREEFELEQPIDQKLKNYNIGFEYAWDKSSVTINQRWRDFYNDAEIFLLSPSEGSHPIDPTQLDSFFLEQPYGYNSRETQVDFTIRPNKNWQLQANLLYADLNMDFDSSEIALGIDFLGEPLQYNLTAEGQSKRTIRQLYISSGYAITDRMKLTASIREQNLDQNSDLDLDDVASENQWLIDSTTAAIGFETRIHHDWTLSAGLTIEDRETRYLPVSANSEQHENEITKNDGYYLILGYRPKNGLTLSVSAEKNIIDDPFTLSSPADSQFIRLRAAYKWDSGFKLSSAYVWRKSENDLSGWEANSNQTSLRLSYTNDPLTLSFGTTLVDIDRSIDQLVTGGFVQALFPIYYRADSDFWDGLVRWNITAKTHLMTSYRHYENNGSFEVKRNDVRIGINFELPKNYSLGANYRNIDYKEDFENFDAEIMEVTFGLRW